MLIDGFNRKIDYLRVSVTERCNFRCQYCMPEKPFEWVPKENLLNFDELFMFIRVAIDSGIRKIRITGGEPTLRHDLDRFIKMIYDYDNSVDLALTTNGYFLKEFAKPLKEAGLKRINVSLDSLKKETTHYIAKKDVFENVVAGIDEALRVGLKVKINCVPLKGINDGEIIDILEHARAKGMSVRFIEYMQNNFANSEIQGLGAQEILETIAKQYPFTKLGHQDNSPATYYRLDDGYEFGVIEPHRDDFCENCNRIRLNAEGFLIPCLYFDEAMSIKEAMRSKDIDKATQILQEVIKNKPEKNRWSEDEVSSRAFYETGG